MNPSPDLTGLIDALARDGGEVILGRTGHAHLDALVAPFQLEQLKLSRAAVAPSENGLVMTGHAHLASLGTAGKTTVTLSHDAAGNPLAVLRLSVDGPASIFDLFGPNQPNSAVADATGYIVDVPSVIGPLLIENAVFTSQSGDTTSGQFIGDFSVDQTSAYPLTPYTPFPLSPTVSLSGTWQGDRTTGAQFTLFGSSASGIALPDFITDYGLRLSNAFNVTGGDSDTPVSGAAFYMTSNLDGAILTVPLLYNDGHWGAHLALTEHVTLAQGVDELMSLLGDGAADAVTLPPGLDLFSSFYVDYLHLGLDPGRPGEAPSVTQVGVGIGSDAVWQPPVPVVNSIGKIGATFIYNPPAGEMPGIMVAGVTGELTLGKEPAGQLTLDCSLSLPTFDIDISQPEGEKADFGAFLTNVFGTAVLPEGWALSLSALQASILMAEREFHAVMDLAGAAPLGDDHIRLTELGARIDIYPNDVEGLIWAQLTISGDGASATPDMTPTPTPMPMPTPTPSPSDIVFAVQAGYGGSAAGWTFEGGLAQGTGVDVAAFVAALTNEPAPGWLTDLNIRIENVWFSYSTGGNNPYSATGAVSGTIPLQSVLGVAIDIAATATAQRDSSGAKSGSLSGSFQVGNLTVTGMVAFAEVQTWDFKVQWKGVTFDAVTTPVADRNAPGITYNVIRITLSGVTLGDIVTDLVEMIDPYLDVTLDAPWNALNDIDMSRARLSIDSKYSTLTVELEIGLDLGFVDINTIRLVYDRSSTKGSIRYEIDGNFLGQSYGGDAPLSWDAINDSPPAVPAQGNSLLDIHYMGLGQHISIGQPATINNALIAMSQVLVPPKGQGNPIPLGAFSADTGWVAGLDMTLMGFIGLRMVFDDPTLYGLHVALSGEEAKALDGLAIDLTYRRLSDDVGVFNVQLALPDKYRQIELGAVSVTLGVISVSVFTDGGFEIDLGFPHGGDFTNAYTVEAGPFLGRGGLYFGVLESGGSNRVPLASNGNFAPVIELGVGFAGGLGRDFTMGPLSAGAYIQLEAIFEGALAWFHPTDAAQPVETYYYCRATAGIAGRVFGSVDFGIISASVEIGAQVTATLVIEAYRATMVDLDAEVSVSAEVHLLFFHISFSFDLHLELTFQIGDDSTAPWVLAPGTGADGAQRIDRIYARARRTARRGLQYLYEAHLENMKALGTSLTLDWKKGEVSLFGGKFKTVGATIVPALTLDSPPVQWTTTPVPAPNPAPTTLVTFTPSTLPANDGADPIDVLSEAMLRWALAAAGQLAGPAIDVGALVDLNRRMPGNDVRAQFNWNALNMLFGRNLTFQFEDFDASQAVTGSVLPMPPVFGRTDGQGTSPAVDYWTQTPISEAYETALAAWIAAMQPGEGAAASDKTRLQSTDESFPGMIFHSYFYTMAKAIVGEAVGVAGSWTYTLGTSLTDNLTATFPPRQVTYIKTAGATIDTAAACYGVSVDELAFFIPDIAGIFADAAPGQTVTFDIGVTPQSIVAGNPGLALAADTSCDLAPLPWQTRSSDTLAAIAGASLAQWLAEPDSDPDSIADDLRALQAAAALAMTGYAWDAPTGLTAGQRDAALYVRLVDAPAPVSAIDPKLTSWCSSYIAANNTGLTFDSSGAPVTTGTTINVPTDQAGGKTTWLLLPGDTLSRIARAAALLVNPTAAADFAAFAKALDAANPNAGSKIVLPANTATTILTNESPRLLAKRLLLDVTDPVFVALIGPAQVLAPMQTLVPPSSIRAFKAGTTMQQIATASGLSLEAVGQRLAQVDNLFAAGITVSVAHAPSLPTEPLVAAAMAAGGVRVRNQMSRFMLQGMRMPVPAQDSDGLGASLASLAALAGQEAALSDLLLKGGDYQSIFDFPHENPNWITLPAPGQLTVGMPAADVNGHLPGPVLCPAFVDPQTPAAPAPLSKQSPVHWDLAQRLVWMAPSWPQDLLGSDPGTGSPPSLWPLPSSLLDAWPTLGNNDGLHLQRIDPQAAPGVAPDPVQHWCLGTRVDIAIRQTGTHEVYEVVGVDSGQNDLLLSLWQGIGAATFEIAFLYQPAAADGAAAGLASSLAGSDATVIIQTNLSTEPYSGPEATDTNPYAARSSDVVAFLQLVWECGVVGGGGYWLRIGTADEQGLPSTIFDRNGRATLTLLVAETGQAGKSTQTLAAYHNIVLVGDNIAPATSHVFVASTTLNRAIAVMDTGKAGFSVDLFEPVGAPQRRPDGTIDSDPTLRTSQIFQLLGYRLVESDVFRPSPIGLPVPPKVPPASAGATDDQPRWHYSQTVPLYRFAKLGKAPAVTGLPRPSADPYGGIALAPDGSAAAAATVELWFQDLFGNATQDAPTDVGGYGDVAAPPPPNVYRLDLPSFYVDPVMAIDQWPSTAALYRVTGTDAAPMLEVDVKLKMSAYSPGASQLGSALTKTIARHRDQFAQVWYQLHRPDFTATLSTSLTPGAPQTPIDLAALRSYAGGAYAYLASAAQLLDETAAAGCTTIDQICDTYGVGYSDLAQVNGGVLLESLFASCNIPSFAVAAQNRSLTDLVGKQAAAVLAMAENADLLLTGGIELVTPSRLLQAAQDTLTAIAKAANCSIASLVQASAGMAWFVPGVVLTVGAASVTTTATMTLEDAVKALGAAGAPTTALALARSYADCPGVVAPGAALATTGWLTGTANTLADKQSGYDQPTLAPLNVEVANLYPAGTPITTGETPATAGDLAQPLATVATVHGVSLDQLIASWGQAALVTNGAAALSLPGRVVMPADTGAIAIPYTIQSHDQLATLAKAFKGATAESIVAANWDAPATIAAGAKVEIGGATVEAAAGDSLHAVALRFPDLVGPTQIAAAIAGQPDALNPGALLICPPALAPATEAAIADATPWKLTDLAGRYGVQPAALGMANAGLADWLAPGAVFTYAEVQVPPAANGASAADLSSYSLTSVVSVFRQLGVAVSTAELIAQNLDVPIIRPGALFLLPPQPVAIAQPLPVAAAYPQAIFALTTTMTFARDKRLVAPELIVGASQAALQAETRIAPDSTGAAAPSPGAPAPLSYLTFAQALQAALPQLLVASGTVGANAQSGQLWAVSAGATGLSKAEVTASPSFYALRPLYPQPVSRDSVALMRRAKDGGGTTTADVRNADVEVWARAFLSDVETFLDADHALRIYDAAADAQQKVLASKAPLAAAVAAGLENLLIAGAGPARDAAQVELAQGLAESLTAGWATSAMLQYPAATAAPAGQGNVRLPMIPQLASGSATGTGMGTGQHTNLTGGALDFSAPSSYLHFAATISASDESCTTLTLTPSVRQVEFGIAPIPPLAYDTSDWLSFLLPAAAAAWRIELGVPVVPVLARSYPASPLPIAQSSESDAAAGDGWLAAPLWRYRMSFSYAAAPQDQIVFGATFNAAASAGARNAAPDPGLFEALATYQANRASIWQDIETGDLASGARDFAAAVAAILIAWQAHWPQGARDARMASLYRIGTVPADTPPGAAAMAFCGTLIHANGLYRWLEVTPVDNLPLTEWPEIGVDCGGQTHMLIRVEGDQSRQTYAFPPTATIAVGASITYHVSIGGLHLASYQEAFGGIAVIRNAALLGLDGPPIVEDFVYRAPPAVFPHTVAPYLSFNTPFDAGPWSPLDSPNDLAAILERIMVGPSSALTTLSIELRSDSDTIAPSLPLRLPVAYSPQAQYPGTVTADIATQLQSWAQQWDPPEGQWEIIVTAYATLGDRLNEPLILARLLFST